MAALQDDLNRRTEETQKQATEISLLSSQVASLERTIRNLTVENEELESALSLAHECQSELSLELIEVKEKQANLLAAFHEKQEECRELAARRRSTLSDLLPYVDSLAYELEQSSSYANDAHHGAISNLDEVLFDDQYDHSAHHHQLHHPNHPHLHHQCPTPDSLLSNDSFYTSSPFTSFSGPSTSAEQQQQPPSSQSPSLSAEEAIITSSTVITTTITTSSPSSSTSSIQESSSISNTASTSTSTRTSNTNSRFQRHHFLTDKLRYIKPLEGSQTLHQWRRLASPNLNNLFEDKDNKYFSRIKANLAASEVALAAATAAKNPQRLPASSSSTNASSPSATSSVITTTTATRSLSPTRAVHLRHSIGNNFVTTNSVFTFTTTSVSQTRESVTHVTSTYSSVQSSTGKEGSTFSSSQHQRHDSTPLLAHTGTATITVATQSGQPPAQVRIW